MFTHIIRKNAQSQAYDAYLCDPDNNKICAYITVK